MLKTLGTRAIVLTFGVPAFAAPPAAEEQWTARDWYLVGSTCDLAKQTPASVIESREWLGWRTEVKDQIDDAGRLTTVKIHSEATIYIAGRYKPLVLDMTFVRSQKACDIATAARMRAYEHLTDTMTHH